MITRRAWVGGAIALASCARRRGTGFPGFAIVASETEHALSAVSLERFRVIRQLHLEAAPSQVLALAGSPNPHLMLCLLPSRGTVIAIDNEAFAVRAKVRVADESLSMLPDENGKRVWVLNKSPNTLVAVDLNTFKTGARVRLAGTPASLDFHAETKRAAVSLPSEGAIAIVEEDRVARTIAAGIAPEMITFRPDGEIILASSANEQMMAVADPGTGQMLVKLALPLKPRRYCYNSNGGQLFITGEGMDAITIVYPYQTEVNQTILAGQSPTGMAATPDYLFVANSGSGDVTILDIETQRVVARITVGQEPRDVILTPDSQYALVLNHKSGDMAVIRIASIGAANTKRPVPGWVRRSESSSLFTMIPVCDNPVSAAISTIRTI